jgi:predicted HTH transcriptional regulator
LDSYQDSELEPDIAAGEDHVKIALTTLNYHIEEDIRIIKKQKLRSNVSSNIDKIMAYLSSYETIKRSEIEQLLKVSKSQAGEYIKKLLDRKLVKRVGN